MSSLTDNPMAMVHVDMNMLSMFASESDVTKHDMQPETAQPTSIVGKLFRIIGAAFGTSNVTVYTSANIDTENKV